MKLKAYPIAICIILLTIGAIMVPLYMLANANPTDISFTVSGNLTNVFGPDEGPHTVDFSFNLLLTVDGETREFVATGNGTYTASELDGNNLTNNLALTGNIKDNEGAEVSDCTIAIVYTEDVLSSPAPMSLIVTIDAPNCMDIPDFHWESSISGTQSWEGETLSIRDIVSNYATLTGLGVDMQLQLLDSTATCNGTFTNDLVFEMPTLGLLNTQETTPSPTPTSTTSPTPTPTPPPTATPTATPTPTPSPTPEPEIPEGFPIGVMVLLSSIAVIVSMLYFRKRPKL